MRPLIDSHIHLWDPYRTPRPATPLVKALGWNRRLLHGAAKLAIPKESLDFIGKPDYVSSRYLKPQYEQDIVGLTALGYEFRGAVHVEAGWKAKSAIGLADETAWLESSAADCLTAIVGAAELDHPELARLLDAHSQASPTFVGIRDKLAFDPRKEIMSWARSAKLMSNRQWLRGLQMLGSRNLSFDAWVYAPQLPQLYEALAASSDTRSVLCHMGTPIALQTDAEQRKQWQRDMQKLAKLPNVKVKLSGFTMPIVGWKLHNQNSPVDTDQLFDLLSPHYRFVLDCFGEDRCLFGSNFPIDKVSVGYSQLVEVLDRVLDHHGDAARHKVFHDNAKGFYGKA